MTEKKSSDKNKEKEKEKESEDGKKILSDTEKKNVITTSKPTENNAQTVRYDRLQTLAYRCLQQCTKSLTYDTMVSCYPKIASHNVGKGWLNQGLEDIKKFWETSSEREFNSIWKERDIKRKLDELDGIILEGKKRQKRWSEMDGKAKRDDVDAPLFPDTITPDQILQTHLLERKKNTKKKLEDVLDTLKKENEQELVKMNNIAKESHEIYGKLNNILNEVEKLTSGNIIDDEKVLQLRKI